MSCVCVCVLGGRGVGTCPIDIKAPCSRRRWAPWSLALLKTGTVPQPLSRVALGMAPELPQPSAG